MDREKLHDLEKIYDSSRSSLLRGELNILWLSMATAALSFAISESAIFRSLRRMVEARNRVLGKLVSCGYCLSHWIALAVVVIALPSLGFAQPLDFAVVTLVIAWLSAIQWAALCVLMKAAGK